MIRENNGNPEGDTGNSANSYDGDYTIGSPYYRTPVGYFSLSDSLYGTFDQGGNVAEWNETVIPTVEAPYSERGLRGGAFGDDPSYAHANARSHADPWTFEHQHIGFRVASIPEPGSIVLAAVGGLCLFAYTWRRRRS